ncbi:dihydroorotate dehydrogenase electron transfer subunit [Oceanobacillus sp. CFH 90083]|uniref:dihydroorotate dehydrogenase electron transfer subunit n=1 Tax=Oceanobacillus sp. CFH 90083 TaxID=2592336 RepID=UPI00128BAEFC|nr:dihydroorotate dehydrogenase electron transfer subunit [Oceanobacillus sp. CFH 90083]
MKPYDLKIISNVRVSERYWHLKLDARPIADSIRPGQFFNIKCADLAFLRRPFSIYRINKEEKTIEFLYLVKGNGTVHLTEAAPGEYLNIFGPLGNGFELKKEWNTVLLLARGVGIATLAALAQEAAANQVTCIAVLSARTNNDLLSTEMLERLGVEVYKVTEEDGTSDVEAVEKLIENLLKANRIQAAFTCGSKRLSKLLQRMAKMVHLPAQIALEEHMGCAMGVCYACVCDIQENDDTHSVRVCREGPVFDLNKVVLK